MALAFPTAPTPGQIYAAPNGVNYIFTSPPGVWVKQSSSVLPATLAEAAAGSINTKYSSPETSVPKSSAGMTGSAYIPAGNTLQRPAAGTYAGQFRYNTQIPQLEYSDGTSWLAVGGGGGSGTVTSVTGTLPITVATGTTTPVIAINAATNAAAGAIEIATLAEAAAGTDATRALTPESGVPKDASGMAGAAILPSGTTAQQPGTLVTGMTRYNTTTGDLEFYTGSAWNGVTTKVIGAGATYDEGASVLPSGTVLQRPATGAAGMVRYSTALNALEFYQASTTSWQPVEGGGAVIKAFVNIGITPAGIVTIFSSFNVASVVNIGGFYYDITFTNPFPNLQYAVLGSAVSTGVVTLVQADPGPAPTSTSVHQVRTYFPLSSGPGSPLTGSPVWTFSASWLFVSYP
jgi:hypothetical protein